MLFGRARSVFSRNNLQETNRDKQKKFGFKELQVIYCRCVYICAGTLVFFFLSMHIHGRRRMREWGMHFMEAQSGCGRSNTESRKMTKAKGFMKNMKQNLPEAVIWVRHPSGQEHKLIWKPLQTLCVIFDVVYFCRSYSSQMKKWDRWKNKEDVRYDK